MPIQHLALEGNLSLDGVDLNNQFGAWGVIPERGRGGLVQLWTDAEVRGDNRLLPSVTGVIMYEHRVTETPIDLRLVAIGDIDGQTGLTNTNAVVGLEANLDYLYENVVAPPGSSTGARVGILTMPSGEERTTSVQVLRTTVQDYLMTECAAIWIATLRIRLPEGRFANGSSS